MVCFSYNNSRDLASGKIYQYYSHFYLAANLNYTYICEPFQKFRLVSIQVITARLIN